MRPFAYFSMNCNIYSTITSNRKRFRLEAGRAMVLRARLAWYIQISHKKSETPIEISSSKLEVGNENGE
jgi:hypothetical protein